MRGEKEARHLARLTGQSMRVEVQPVAHRVGAPNLEPDSARACLEQIASFSRPYFQLSTLSLLAPWFAGTFGSIILSGPADQTITLLLAS